MEPQNINKRFEQTQRKLSRRFYACLFLCVSIGLYTLIGLMAEFPFTKNRWLLLSIFLFELLLVYYTYKIEKRIEKNGVDAGQGKSIKHIKTKF